MWCNLCAVQVRKRLLALPELARLAALTGDGHRGGPDSERVRGGSVEASTNSPAYDNLEQLLRELERVRDELRTESPIGRVNSRSIASPEALESVVGWLSHRFDQAIQSDTTGKRLGLTVHVWYTRLVKSTKSGSGTINLSLACPRCETRSLQQQDGDDTVRCTNGRCGREMTKEDYQLYERAIKTWERQADDRGRINQSGPARVGRHRHRT